MPASSVEGERGRIPEFLEATRITNRDDAQSIRSGTTPWEDDGGSGPGDGDGMPIFDESPTAG